MDQCITQIREEILKLLMNENTLKILNQLIGNNNDLDGNTLSITKINLTRKQFYTKLNELITKGLIKKEKGKYYLTTYGKIVYDLTSEYKNKLGIVIEDYWKFKAIDLLDISDELTNDERHKIIEYLFKQINQNNNSTDPLMAKELITYKQYLQKRELASKM